MMDGVPSSDNLSDNDSLIPIENSEYQSLSHFYISRELNEESASPLHRFRSICDPFRIIRIIQLSKKYWMWMLPFTIITSCIGIFFLLSFGPCNISGMYRVYHTSLGHHHNVVNVVILGDSLVTGTKYPIFHLISTKIIELLPNYNLNVMDFGQRGDGITAIITKLSSLFTKSIDCVILIFDSDVNSNLDGTPASMDLIRQNYINNVSFVISKIYIHIPGVKVALAGPIISGEGPLISPVSTHKWHRKSQLLDEYRILNENIAIKQNATYIDVRSAFLEEIPRWHLGYQNCVTVDGEHPSYNGILIMAKMFADYILQSFPPIESS